MRRRAVSVPLDHLDAELYAAPFVDPSGLAHAVTSLDPGLRHHGTLALWRSTEQRLSLSFPNIVLDELIARRDRIWFDATTNQPRPLLHVMRSIGSHIERDGADGQAPAAQRRRLRWLTFALPRDLITACLGNPARTTSPLIESLLAEGVVEPHLHLGAAADFGTLWIVIQHTIAEASTQPGLLESPGAAFDEGRALAPWLIQTLIVRALLARYLTLAPGAGFIDDLEALLGRLDHSRRQLLTHVVRAVATGRSIPTELFARLQSLYIYLLGIKPGDNRWASDLQAVHSADCIAPWFIAGPSGSSEQRYVQRALEAIEASADEDPLFTLLFWQTIRLRVALYQHLVQRPLIGGLQWFTRAFSRIRAVRGALSVGTLTQCAQRSSGPITALEVRFTPGTSPTALEGQLARVIAAARGDLKLGVILHLSRSRGGAHSAGRPAAFDRGTHAEIGTGYSRPMPSGTRFMAPLRPPFRYAHYYRDRRNEARAIIDLLRTRPATVEILRGIDVCGDELGVPLWVLAPLLKAIREVGRRAAAFISRRGHPVPPPQLMVHAGEDYVHLLGGLRRIDEYIEHLNLDEGDRIAHAMALGEDVERWCGAAFGRVQSREDNLLDLLWAWRRLRETPSTLLASWGNWIETRIRRRVQEIFASADISIELLAEAESYLYDPFALRLMGFPNQPESLLPASDDRALSLARRWITDTEVFRRGRQLDEVDPQPLAPLLTALQHLVRRRLSERSIIIEVNPTSNLLTGALSDLGQHPFWRLNPIEPDGTPSLMVCIGSDDPITFATTLPEEFQLIYDSLIEAGVSSDRALGWIDAARRVSLRGRVAQHIQHHSGRAQDRWPAAPAPLEDVLLP